jgi:hypothetical protein
METNMDRVECTLERSKKLLTDSELQRTRYIRVSGMDGPGSELSLRLGNAPKGNPMDINFAIWLLRKSRSMTQSQVASRMKTSREQVSDLEIFQMPTIATLLRISRALQVTPRCLLLIAEARGKRESAPQLKCGGKNCFEPRTEQQQPTSGLR